MSQVLTSLLKTALVLGLPIVRSNAILPKMVWRDIAENPDNGSKVSAYGDTIKISIPGIYTPGDVTYGTLNPTDISRIERSFTLAYKKEITVGIGYTELNDMIKAGVLKGEIEAMMIGMADYVDSILASLWKKIPYSVNMTGVVADITGAKKVLSKNKVNMNDMGLRYIMSSDLEDKYLQLTAFSSAADSGNSGVISEGRLGRKFGFDMDKDQNLDSASAYDGTGTLATTDTPTVQANAAKDASSITLIQSSGSTKTLKIGDILKFAGDSLSYSVQADASLPTATATPVSISPNLRCAISASAAVTVTRPTGGQVGGLAFHQKAFALASRPMRPINETNPLRAIATMQDPVSGLVFQLEYEAGHAKDYVTLFCLFGCDIGLQPELACRGHYAAS